MVPDRRGPGPFQEHRYYILLLFVNVALSRLAMEFYPGDFVLTRDALSDLGAAVTRTGLLNPRAPYVFVPQMLLSAGVLLRLASHITSTGLRGHQARAPLARLAGAGFVLMIAPHDLPLFHYVHLVGTALMFFALWRLSMWYLGSIRRERPGLFAAGQLVLQSTVLTYAVLFFLDSPHKQTAQAAGLAGLAAALILSTVLIAWLTNAARPEDGEPVHHPSVIG